MFWIPKVLPRNTLSYIYTPLFRSQSLNKDRILSSEDNRFRCDSESEKKNVHVARKKGWNNGRKDQRKEEEENKKKERIASC